MIKKYLILLIMFLICYNNYAKLNVNNLKNKYITTKINFDGITVDEAFQIIGQEIGVSFFTDSDVKNIVLDINFSKGESIYTLIDTICEIYNLKILSIYDMYLITKENKINEKFNICGTIKAKEYNIGLDKVKITVANGVTSSVFTNYKGKYIIPNIDPGVYILKFEKEGYISKYELINLKKRVTVLNVELEKDNCIKLTNDFDSKKTNSFDFKSTKFITKKIALHHIDTKEIKKILINNYENRLKVSILPKRHILIISGTKNMVENALSLIKELDEDIKQVRISAQILDVTNNLFESLGFSWAYNNNKLNSDSSVKDITIGFLNSNNLIGIGEAYNSSINIIRQFNNGNDILNLGVNLLESTQDLVVSARPSILVVSGEEGIFKVTEEVIVGNKKHENNNSDSVTYTPIFKEAGIILKVKPIIKNKEQIILDVLIEVSNFKLKKQGTNSENDGTFNSEGGSKVGRSIKTTITIKDGQTIFIGGLKKAIVHNTDSKVPFFGTLPMVKFFFKNENINHEMSDIYIKLKVDIVEDENCCFDRDEIHQRVSEIVNNKIY